MSQSNDPNFGTMRKGNDTIALQPTPLPIVYFDRSPAVCHHGGVVGITLTASAYIPKADGSVVPCIATAAFLKCNIQAARDLIIALQNALLLATPTENPESTEPTQRLN